MSASYHGRDPDDDVEPLTPSIVARDVVLSRADAALLASLSPVAPIPSRAALPAWMCGDAAPDERAVAAVERATHPRR